MQHEGFRAGDFTTHFVDQGFDPEVLQIDDSERDELAALAATLYYRHTQERALNYRNVGQARQP